MVPSYPTERIELPRQGTTVTAEYDHPGHAYWRWAPTERADTALEVAGLVREGLHRARVRGAARVEMALDVSPRCGLVLEALRRRRGNEVDRMVLRRAGSSVMVTLELRPWPTLSRPAAGPRAAMLPTQPVGCLPRRRGAGAPSAPV